MNRRSFLIGASTAALAAAMPPVAVAPVAAAEATAPVVGPLLAFAVGTPGEYDWEHIVARSAEEAWRIWMEDNYHDYDWDNPENNDGEPEPTFDPDMVTRVELWDGKRDTTSADWFAAGLGHVCDRCGYETSPDFGGRIVGDDVICEGCLTWADRLAAGDHEDIVDEIANQLCDEPEADVRAWLAREKLLPTVDDLGLWARAQKAAAS